MLFRSRYLGENSDSRLILLIDTVGAMLKVSFSAPDDVREPMIVDVEEFIAVKSFKAKGKRLTTFNLAEVEELEPKSLSAGEAEGGDEPEAEESTDDKEREDSEDLETEEISDEELRDDIIGQQRLF